MPPINTNTETPVDRNFLIFRLSNEIVDTDYSEAELRLRILFIQFIANHPDRTQYAPSEQITILNTLIADNKSQPTLNALMTDNDERERIYELIVVTP